MKNNVTPLFRARKARQIGHATNAVDEQIQVFEGFMRNRAIGSATEAITVFTQRGPPYNVRMVHALSAHVRALGPDAVGPILDYAEKCNLQYGDAQLLVSGIAAHFGGVLEELNERGYFAFYHSSLLEALHVVGKVQLRVPHGRY